MPGRNSRRAVTAAPLRIVSRKSPLALWQARFVARRLQKIHPDLDVDIHGAMTTADRFLHKSLISMGGKGAFVKELEHALLNDEADLAVHSMKDVPAALPAGLSIAAVLRRDDPRDVLLSNRYAALAELPAGARIGTSSLRRRCQLNAHCPGLNLTDMRGNLGSRLRKLDEGACDGLILAAAGLRRLGKEDRIRESLDVRQMLPAIGQGALGVETRDDDQRVLRLVRPLNHEPTRRCVNAERAVGRALQGGCHLPIAAYAQEADGELSLDALAGSPDGARIERSQVRGPADQGEELGRRLAQQLLDQGADVILAEAAKAAAEAAHAAP